MTCQRKVSSYRVVIHFMMCQASITSSLHFQPILHQPLHFFRPFPTLSLKTSLINYNPSILQPHLYPQGPFLTSAAPVTPPPQGVTIYPASTTSLENFPLLAGIHTLQQEALSHNQSLTPLHFPLIQTIPTSHWSPSIPASGTSTPSSQLSSFYYNTPGKSFTYCIA